jgi:hypothetical protein
MVTQMTCEGLFKVVLSTAAIAPVGDHHDEGAKCPAPMENGWDSSLPVRADGNPSARLSHSLAQSFFGSGQPTGTFVTILVCSDARGCSGTVETSGK